MVHCAVPNCSCGTRKLSAVKEIQKRGISFHKFPLDEGRKGLLQKWLDKIHRKDFVPKQTSRICSLHFCTEDFQTERTDKNNRRARSRGQMRKVRTLKNNAVPSVFFDNSSWFNPKTPLKCCELDCSTGKPEMLQKVEPKQMGKKKSKTAVTVSADEAAAAAVARLKRKRRGKVVEEVTVDHLAQDDTLLQVDSEVTLHRFPLDDPELLKKWVQKLKRKDFKPTTHSRLCSKHFDPDDIEIVKTDTSLIPDTVVMTKLKPGAFPYPTKKEAEARRKKDAEEEEERLREAEENARKAVEVECSKVEEQTEVAVRANVETGRLKDLIFKHGSRFVDMDDMESQLRAYTELPKGFEIIRREDTLLLCLIDMENQNFPRLRASIKFESSLRCCVNLDGKYVPEYSFAHIGKSNHILTLPQVLSLMKEVKSWVTGEGQKNPEWLKMAQECLENFVRQNSAEEAVDPDFISKVTFILEQLQLRATRNRGRRFSTQMMSFAYWLYTFSRQTYRQLFSQDLVILPNEVSVRKLRHSVGIRSKQLGPIEHYGEDDEAEVSDASFSTESPMEDESEHKAVKTIMEAAVSDSKNVVYMTEEEFEEFLMRKNVCPSLGKVETVLAEGRAFAEETHSPSFAVETQPDNSNFASAKNRSYGANDKWKVKRRKISESAQASALLETVDIDVL